MGSQGQFALVRRRSKVAVVVIVAVFAFVFLAPVIQVTFVLRPGNCPSLSSWGCMGFYDQGYGSFIYRLFGVGGTYLGSGFPNAGFGIVL